MSIEEKATTAIDQTLAQPNEAAVSAALAVLDRFMAALNGGDETALLATLHFPPLPARREQDAAVGSARNLPWRLLRPRRPGLAPQWMGFSQGYRRRRHQGALGRAIYADNSVIGSFRSLWIVTKDGGRWGRRSAVELCGLVCMIGGLPQVQLRGGRTSSGGWRITVRRPRL